MKPSPYARIPRGPRWYAQVAEYQNGPPTLGAAKENTMLRRRQPDNSSTPVTADPGPTLRPLVCIDGQPAEFSRETGKCMRATCNLPAWMHWTVRP